MKAGPFAIVEDYESVIHVGKPKDTTESKKRP
jgi:hypothetical protein